MARKESYSDNKLPFQFEVDLSALPSPIFQSCFPSRKLLAKKCILLHSLAQCYPVVALLIIYHVFLLLLPPLPLAALSVTGFIKQSLYAESCTWVVPHTLFTSYFLSPSSLEVFKAWDPLISPSYSDGIISFRGHSSGAAPCPRALGESVCLCGQQARPLSDCVVSGSVGWRPLECVSCVEGRERSMIYLRACGSQRGMVVTFKTHAFFLFYLFGCS